MCPCVRRKANCCPIGWRFAQCYTVAAPLQDAQSGVCPRACGRRPQAELLADQFTQAVCDLAVSWDRGLSSRRRVAVEVVPAAVADELAPGRLQFPDERLPLHTSSSTGSRW